MTVELIELLVGLYFIGAAIAITKVPNTYARTIDLFKLVYGIILVVVALYHGVKI